MRHSLYLASVLFGLGTQRVVNAAPQPATTPAPRVDIRQLNGGAAPRDVDPISLAEALITAIPESLRQIAATNLPQASKILWSEFLDGKRPDWFTGLPTDIQTYLVSEFSPATTASNTSPSAAGSTSRTDSPVSQTAAITSFVTVTANPGPTDAASQSGLSAADKVGIGLGVPLALLLIAAIILACCLCGRRRRRRVVENHHVESRPPTPAFLGTTMAPKHANTTLRGGSGGPLMSDSDDSINPFADPPPAALGAVRNGRGSRSSYGSLTAVPEEEAREHEHGDLGVLPAKPHRRSRGASMDLKNQYAATTSPLDHSRRDSGPYVPNDWQHQHPALRSRDSGGPYPALEANDWQNQHPALRDSGSFSTPQGPYNTNRNSISRKPVAVANDDVGNLGNYSTVTSGARPTRDAILPSQNMTGLSPPPRRSDWPFERTTNNSNSNNSYWKVQLPKTDRYERVHDGM